MYEYLSIFLLGGTLFTVLFHYSRNNNTIVTSIIPAFPTLFLTGLLYIISFNIWYSIIIGLFLYYITSYNAIKYKLLK